jgi:hypothetical protein
MGDVASADVVVIEASAIGTAGMVVHASRKALLQAAQASGTPVWVESGVGRVLPPGIWSALERRLRDPRDAATSQARGSRATGTEFPSDVIEPLDGVELVIGPAGPSPVSELNTLVTESGCPEPPELTSDW